MRSGPWRNPHLIFLSHDFDDCMERALNASALRRETADGSDRLFAEERPKRSSVTDKLGRGLPSCSSVSAITRTPLQFALTEGDVVEYPTPPDAEYRPNGSSASFTNGRCSCSGKFPDWLTRIFLRMSAESLHQGESKQYVADSKKDPQLLFFFLRTSPSHLRSSTKWHPLSS